MYNALENMGFKRGNILEPSCGVGNFMGLLPESMDAKMYGVELDSLSGRIARQLYQKNGITIDGYEKTHFPDSFFDVAIGNVPFNDFKLLDKKYDKHGCEFNLEELHKQVENAKAEIAKPFPREAELDEKCKRLAELNAELNMDRRENEIVDGVDEQSEEEHEEKRKTRDNRDDR